MKGIVLYIVFLLMPGEFIYSKPINVQSSAAQVDTAFFDGNRILSYMKADGFVVSNEITGSCGLFWPKDKRYNVGFSSSLSIIGRVEGEIRTSWSEYASEFSPGPALDASGIIDSSVARIFKISQNHLGDWAKWPWQVGAPVLKRTDGADSLDVNGDRIPQLLGDQTLWMVINDFNPEAHQRMFLTEPLGIEMQITVFGFDDVPPYSDMMFVKWLFINNGENFINDAYVTLFYDYDIGDASNDRVGCDTTLSLGYGYSKGYDAVFGDFSPGAGFVLLQGPLVPAPGQLARAFGRIIEDQKNLPMTSFIGWG